ncbi:hypothetical protein [Leucobacter soli]|uniref:hypothetical protein n=1 Tax=Leucobacter soli TaxID=2812850 RepID=UPI00360AC021
MSEPSEPAQRRPGSSASVRTRIVAVITVVTALCLLAVGASVILVERHRILEDVDQRLTANLESARFIVGEGNPATGKWESSTEALTDVVRRMSPDDHTGALGMDGGKITIVPGMALDLDLRSAGDFAAYVDAALGDDPIIGTYAEEGTAWRYLAVPISVADSPPRNESPSSWPTTSTQSSPSSTPRSGSSSSRRPAPSRSWREPASWSPPVCCGRSAGCARPRSGCPPNPSANDCRWPGTTTWPS